MTFKDALISALVALLCSNAACHASSLNDKFKYPFYAGITGGYSKTTWNALVPDADNLNSATSLSTPVSVNEGGATWGLFAGYEFLPYFAVEAAYQRYPDATIKFDPLSLFTYQHHGMTEFESKTETVSMQAKIMMIIPKSDFRVFSSFGAAELHRCDLITDRWHLSPMFGAGLNYNFTDHIMTELGGNYTAGWGESELSPAEDYIPFLYSIYFRLAYRF